MNDLIRAISSGDIDHLQRLLDDKINPKSFDSNTPISAAVITGNVLGVEELLNYYQEAETEVKSDPDIVYSVVLSMHIGKPKDNCLAILRRLLQLIDWNEEHKQKARTFFDRLRVLSRVETEIEALLV